MREQHPSCWLGSSYNTTAETSMQSVLSECCMSRSGLDGIGAKVSFSAFVCTIMHRQNRLSYLPKSDTHSSTEGNARLKSEIRLKVCMRSAK